MKNVPENLEIVPDTNLTMISVDGTRSLHAVPHVKKFGHTFTPGNDKYEFACRNELEFCFRLESQEAFAEDEMDGVFYRHQFPHLFVKRAHVQYRYQIHARRYAQFIIYPVSAEAEFLASGIMLDPPGLVFELTDEIRGMLAELRAYETCVHNRGNPDRIDLLAFRLISTLYLQQNSRSEESAADQKIRQIASLLESDPVQCRDLTEIALQFGFSRRSFFRRWNQLYDLTPTQFLIVKKMELAQRLLESEQNVSDISGLLGFSSTSYFVQAFKKRFGIPPAEYRKNRKKIISEN